MDFPARCLRGIPRKEFVTPEGSLTTAAFQFQKPPDRQDGWFELSINWEDDTQVVTFTLSQCRDNGEHHFKGGVAAILRARIDEFIEQHDLLHRFSYERQPLPNNPYHGNLLLQQGVTKDTRRAIQGALATFATMSALPSDN